MTISEQYEATLALATTAGPASEDMIRSAEDQLSIEFPQGYRSFLTQYGAAMGAGFEIAGLFVPSSGGPPMWRNVVTMAEQFRRVTNQHVPNTLFPVSDDGCGTAYYIDSAETAADDSICIVRAYGPGIDDKIVAKSFEEFVVLLARDELPT